MVKRFLIVIVIFVGLVLFDENTRGTNWENVPTDAASIAQLTRDGEQGDTDSQKLLGKMYRDGFGVSKDYQLAMNWFKTAGSKLNIEWMYFRGQGVPQDGTPLLTHYIGGFLLICGAVFLTMASFMGTLFLLAGIVVLYVPTGLALAAGCLLFFAVYKLLNKIALLGLKRPE